MRLYSLKHSLFTVCTHVQIIPPIIVFSYLSGKRRSVTAAELEEFKKQAECLHLLQPFGLEPEAGRNMSAVFLC